MGLWQRLRGIEDRQEGGGSYTDALVSLIQSQGWRRVGAARQQRLLLKRRRVSSVAGVRVVLT